MHPILIEIGPFAIRFYGLMYVVAILIGTYLIRKEARRKGVELDDDGVSNFVVWMVLGGILGARVYYVAFNWDYYSRLLSEIPAVWHGGLAIHGGIIGGMLAAFLYLRRKSISFWRMADAAAPAVILGQAFGRFGNFMNGDAHGMPTTLPWGVVFPPESIAGSEFPGIPLHPVMLYEMAANFSIFLILWLVVRKKESRDGFTFAVYLMFYSTARFFMEFFRADSLMLGGLKAAQLVSIGILLVAAAAIFKGRLWSKA